MQVEPARLVELAATSESVLTAMALDWHAAAEDLAAACAGLGDAAGTLDLCTSYADALADAGEVVTGLAQAFGLGIAGLLDAAQDALRTDDAVAGELARTARRLSSEGFGGMPGRGGR
jgi:hypothetical protein